MSGEQDFRHLRVTRDPEGFVVTVDLNRPEAFNAMNTAMGEDLVTCFEALAWDGGVRAVVFTGAGARAFCVGGDLKERQGMSAAQRRATPPSSPCPRLPSASSPASAAPRSFLVSWARRSPVS